MDARTKRKELETEKETEKETKTEKDTAERELDLTPSKKPKVSDEDAKLEALWTSAKCKELVTKQTIVTIDAKDNLLKACEILGSAGVSSAPIWSKDDQKLCGMFDFRDLGAVLLKAFQSELTDTQKKSLHSLDSILKKHSAELASDLSHHDKFYTVDQDASLLDAVDFFGQGLHRVVMLDSDKKAVAILSQSDALKYFWAHLQKGELKWLGDKTVDEMKLIHETVVALDENSPVLDALKLMYERGLSSIAVTERKAKPVITANFSVTDIKYLVRNHKLDTLHEPCKQFIQEVRTTKDRENDYKTTLPVFVITKDTTLSHCVGKLVATRAHRLWVVKGPLDHQVVGVVSLSDILRGITPKDSQHRWRHHPFISFVPSS